MRKYRIYSGAKPISADKTFAVNWGGKYFTVSPITAIQYVPSLTLSNISTSGNTLSVTCSNNGNDNTKMTPYMWYCSNENVNSGTNQSFSFNDTTARIFGPKTNLVYSWDVSSALKPGTNIISASFQSTPASDYQTGSSLATTNKLTIYKEYTAPKVEITGVSFQNVSYGSSKPWTHFLYYFAMDQVSYSVKITNPNVVSAAEYRETAKMGTLAANGSTTETGLVGMAASEGVIGNYSPLLAFDTYQYFLDSSINATNTYTKSAGAKASRIIPKPPVLVSCMPTSASSSNFQVTVKNPNASQYYCRVQYNLSGGTSSDYWLAKCPANGTGTMISSSGSTATFYLTRGSTYILTLYFYTLTGTALSYSGTQVSRTVHYPYKAPDSGFLYASPIMVSVIYDDEDAPSTVTFRVLNINDTTLKAEMDLYAGYVEADTSGTRVDYWMATVPAMASATCPNIWKVSQGTLYTLRCYFMSSSASYHGTAVSGYIDYIFTTPTES